jgi:hypothetical protein
MFIFKRLHEKRRAIISAELELQTRAHKVFKRASSRTHIFLCSYDAYLSKCLTEMKQSYMHRLAVSFKTAFQLENL